MHYYKTKPKCSFTITPILLSSPLLHKPLFTFSTKLGFSIFSFFKQTMQQPSSNPNNTNPTTNTMQVPNSNPNPNSSPKKKEKMKMPTPQELITHYESQGMTPHDASVKAIDDLQRLLFRVVTKKPNSSSKEASRKLDSLNARLAVLEMKLDSKPGFVESFSIGVASAAAFRGVASAWPHVARVWGSVRGASDGEAK